MIPLSILLTSCGIIHEYTTIESINTYKNKQELLYEEKPKPNNTYITLQPLHINNQMLETQPTPLVIINTTPANSKQKNRK
jgi:hypothetical protein